MTAIGNVQGLGDRYIAGFEDMAERLSPTNRFYAYLDDTLAELE